MRIGVWSSDVCSSDLAGAVPGRALAVVATDRRRPAPDRRHGGHRPRPARPEPEAGVRTARDPPSAAAVVPPPEAGRDLRAALQGPRPAHVLRFGAQLRSQGHPADDRIDPPAHPPYPLPPPPRGSCMPRPPLHAPPTPP